MREELLGWLCTWLRVPPQPEPPPGTPESVRVFHAGINYYKWSLIVWAMVQMGALAGIVTVAATLDRQVKRAPGWVYTGWRVLEAAGAASFAVQLPFTFLMQRIDYQMRWYIVTDRSLRIRAGIWEVEETTMTFANIQYVGIEQGPLQRWLGLADVEVSSAGGRKSGEEHGGTSGHTARFAGVDNAEQIRDLILDRLRQCRGSGLGDPDEHGPKTELEAARELAAEARALRAWCERPGRA